MCNFHQLFPEFTAPMEKAEKKLASYLNTGISVLPSQELYNTALFFGLRFYFTGVLPPQATIKTLLEAQHKDGGIKFHLDIKFSDFDTTGFAVLSILPWWIQTKKEKLELALKRCIDYLLLIRNEDGSFPLYAKAKETLPEMTARAIMVTSILPPNLINEDKRHYIIESALEDLIAKQNEDGTFNYHAYSASKLYSMSQAALALHFLKYSPFIDDSKYISMSNTIKERILNYLANCQNIDGSYNAIPFNLAHGEQQSTAYAILAWSSLKPWSDAHFRALNWLSHFTKDNIRSYPEGTGPRPIRYNDLSHGPIFVYLAYISTKYATTPFGMENLSSLL